MPFSGAMGCNGVFKKDHMVTVPTVMNSRPIAKQT
jgi:hypothetical protein